VVNGDDENAEQEQNWIQGAEDGSKKGGIHAQVHRVPADTEQSVDSQARALFGIPDAEGVSKAEPSNKQQDEPYSPDAQGRPLEWRRSIEEGDSQDKDEVLAAVEERSLSKRFRQARERAKPVES
jgi:hypothetical protein